MSFQSQCFIVTGAAGNLGAAVAKALAAGGAGLVLVDRSEDSLAKLAAGLPDASRVLTLGGVDLTKSDEAQRMVAAAMERFGRVDGLVNTIGGFRMGRVAEDALAGWDFLMDINARVALVTSAAVAPVMAARKYGRIVHVSAGAGLKGGAGLAAYSAAKAAVMRITEAMAEEHRADGITVNCVLPSTIDTPQNRAAMPGADTSKWVSPAAIADAIALLLSAQARAITGAAVPVTGLG
jgi:NAD(P)-dependent dehydrogenase (short-subunit alcohol dehydrogenase family)